jgi:hypothetical protein
VTFRQLLAKRTGRRCSLFHNSLNPFELIISQLTHKSQALNWGVPNA